MKLFLRSSFHKMFLSSTLVKDKNYDDVEEKQAITVVIVDIFHWIKNTPILSAIHLGKALFKMCLKWLYKWR